MSRKRGFTLIELLIAVAVIGILAAIAYPSYDSYMKRTRRSEAQQLMLDIANRQSQYLLDARSYNATLSALNVKSREGWTCAATCTNAYYAIKAEVDNTAAPPTYTITAEPKGTQVSDGSMTLDQAGSKSRTLPDGKKVDWTAR